MFSGGVECEVRRKKRKREDGEREGCGNRALKVLEWLGKIAALLLLLYLFVCSLNLLASAFRLVGGRTASEYNIITINNRGSETWVTLTLDFRVLMTHATDRISKATDMPQKHNVL